MGQRHKFSNHPMNYPVRNNVFCEATTRCLPSQGSAAPMRCNGLLPTTGHGLPKAFGLRTVMADQTSTGRLSVWVSTMWM